ncbi:MAG TPA: SDR family NAD(P)-dependent oxidoreductase [Pseudonocardiaceae bacterium]|nr:SDR family NAD(P)-dependent oxidoreductase [Pseudonocardiaceae bacterium]
MSKTIVVVGAGAGLGQAVARKFGREGFAVALVARTPQRLTALASELLGEGIEAAGFPCDVADRAAVAKVVDAIKQRFGTIDVVEFAPTGMDWASRIAPLPDATVESLEFPLDLLVRAPMAIFGAVLPDMIARGDGALLMGTGALAGRAYPQVGNVGIAMAAARNYQLNLNAALDGTGVYAGLLQVGGGIAGSDAIREYAKDRDPGELIDPADLAAAYWDMYVKQDRFEELVGSAFAAG